MKWKMVRAEHLVWGSEVLTLRTLLCALDWSGPTGWTPVSGGNASSDLASSKRVQL